MPSMPDSEKLKKLYNAFNVFPLDLYVARDREFYMDCQKVRGDIDIIHELGTHIKFSEKPTCQLYAGHRGAGKSTELMRLRRHLQEEKGYYVVYFAADEGDIDPEDTRYTDILLACVRQLLMNLKKANPKPIINWLKNTKSSLKEFLYSEVEIDSKIEISSFFGKLTANLSRNPTFRKKVRNELESYTVS